MQNILVSMVKTQKIPSAEIHVTNKIASCEKYQIHVINKINNNNDMAANKILEIAQIILSVITSTIKKPIIRFTPQINRLVSTRQEPEPRGISQQTIV